jgi:hypothetical protein
VDLELTGPEREEFAAALLAAFPSDVAINSLARSVGADPNVAPTGVGLQGKIDWLVEWAGSESNVLDLMLAARTKSFNLRLSQFTSRVARKLAMIGPAVRLLRPPLHNALIGALSQRAELATDTGTSQLLSKGVFGPLRLSIAPAGEVAVRAKQLIDALLPSFLLDGRPALYGLFENLSRDGSGAAASDIDVLLNNLDLALRNIDILDGHFVVAAMTRVEADLLLTTTGEPAAASLPFVSALDAGEVRRIVERYGDTRDAWRPAVYDDQSIRAVIVDMVNRLNQARFSRPLLNVQLIRPSFLSEATFHADSAIRKQARDTLRASTVVVVIVDAVSLLDSTLADRLVGSGLVTREAGPGVVVFFPSPTPAIPANAWAEAQVRNKLEDAFSRFDQDYDRRCEIGVIDERSLRRWIHTLLPDLLGESLEGTPRVAEKWGDELLPTGMQKLWTAAPGEIMR